MTIFYRNFVKAWFLYLLILFNGCGLENSREIESLNKRIGWQNPLDSVYLYQESLPLDFDTFNDGKPINRMKVSDEDEGLIKESVSAYVEFLENEFQQDHHPYLGTLWIDEPPFDIYMVIFQHPFGKLNSKLILKDKNSMSSTVIDYNIHAMYFLERGRIMKTNLRGLLDEKIPLINVISDQNTRSSILEINRLYHNGTANLHENYIFELDSLNCLNAISFTRSPIQNN